MKRTLKVLFFSSFLLSSFCYAMEDNKTDEATHTGFTHVPDDHYSEQDQRAICDMLNHTSTLDLSTYGKTLVVGGAPTQGTFFGMMRNGEFSPSKRLAMLQHPDISFFDANPFERFFLETGISPSQTPFLETLAREFVQKSRLTIGNFNVKNSNDFWQDKTSFLKNINIIPMEVTQ